MAPFPVRIFTVSTRALRTTLALALVLSAFQACANPVPGPPTGPHQADAAQKALIVQKAPPPVQLECVPPQPREECVWIDGSWLWAGRRWEWLVGAWVIPPPGCYHAHAYSQWLNAGATGEGKSDDRLFYFPASWYPTTPGGKCAEPKVCLEATPIEDC